MVPNAPDNGVDTWDSVPPHALRDFILAHPGITDKTHGSGLVFEVTNYEVLDDLIMRFHSSAQFQRVGPVNAAVIGALPQRPLLRAYTLNSMRGPPMRCSALNFQP